MSETTTTASVLKLWSDEPASSDLLSFDAIAETVADALFDPDLNPIALGVSGAWGSGKTTVLNLIKKQVKARSEESGTTVLVVRADPWRYDPTVGPKESLIAEVLTALQKEFKGEDQVVAGATAALKKLVRKVNWSKAIKMAARTALTAQLPSLDAVMELVSDDPEAIESEKGMETFRKDFKALLKEPALEHVSQVVVLVDDLDRCLPETVVETLEAIRLFLSAKGMSFVIAADESRVADAIRQKLQMRVAADETESVASLYLHKIVQTTIPLPALSEFDTRSYLFLLMARSAGVRGDAYNELVDGCNALRRATGSLDDLTLPEAPDLALEMATATRLTPILYEKFQGNPRRIKRFMNDLYVRQSVAERRGIDLSPDAIAKLMVIERLLEKDFEELLKWLAAGQLRERLDELQKVAKGSANAAEADEAPKTADDADDAGQPETAAEGGDAFSSTMVRWAMLPPTLDATKVSGYLTLAAAFRGRILLDEALPEKLRDLASKLTSGSQLEQGALDTDELKALPPGDLVTLVNHLGRRMQDDPSIQLGAANGLITIAELAPNVADEVQAALLRLPAKELQVATVTLFRKKAAEFDRVLEAWEGSATGPVLKAIGLMRKGS
ncbi:P-loop NTPase fold protein [Pseudolysinimonas yzui]|uniref:KAP NTPase domain-containing protein n=1 Tax=Pseudolysinimonas yzui TaxID=2708254 RepID=A0A8J3GPU1_9MICO|nr:KAP family NTPase [Pseudolysinimonas yzui]GHF12501.1 hypothetical protein GCM10011600_11590 [Pseudolysinimonas yzui]